MPSEVNGYEATGESWGRDYAFLVDHFPVEIHPDERIVGEIHWEMHMVRQYVWPEHVRDMEKEPAEMGAGGISSGTPARTWPSACPRAGAGSWSGSNRAGRNTSGSITSPRPPICMGLQMICESVIRFIQRHAEKASSWRERKPIPGRKQTYLRIADCCAHIACDPPRTYYEGVQWIHFAVMMDRVVGHGNGYGRLDLYLIDLYRKSKAAGELSDEEAREYLSEMFLKLRGHFFSLGGRDAELKDATNEMSFVVLEAYDLIGDYNNLGVMWHPDINREFYNYACDVLARHGESIPVLVNYDLMREAELRSGIPEEDAWKVVYSGCQWFCIPGKEYCDQDVNSIIPDQADEAHHRRGDRAQASRDFEASTPSSRRSLPSQRAALRDWKNTSTSCWAACGPRCTPR